MHCTWDTKNKVLSTPEDKNRENEKKLEQAAWYGDKYGDFMPGGNTKKKEKQLLVDPENIYDLDGVHSVKAINMKSVQHNTITKGYGRSPGALTF